jgi:hypothetical protein
MMDKLCFAFAAVFLSGTTIVGWLIDKPVTIGIVGMGVAWIALGLMWQQKAP